MRLDELLVQRGLFPNVHDAQASIMAGEVVVSEHRADSAGMKVSEDACVRLKSKKRTGGFVSRGGLKLQHALDEFGIDVSGLDCADLGASSGGFTDCLLQRGASHVSAVDVGSGQFDWSLRNDARVSLFEKTNMRNVSAQQIGGPFDLAVADLSFISLRAVMDDVVAFLKPRASFVSLLKPQFEASRDEIETGGVVTSMDVHVRCIERVLAEARRCGLGVWALTHSPITGPAGNIEFLFWAKKLGDSRSGEGSIGSDGIMHVVKTAHERLRRDS